MTDPAKRPALAGDAENRDVAESISVLWTNRAHVTEFIPVDTIFRPVLAALEEVHD